MRTCGQEPFVFMKLNVNRKFHWTPPVQTPCQEKLWSLTDKYCSLILCETDLIERENMSLIFNTMPKKGQITGCLTSSFH